MIKKAKISGCKLYRFALWRIWDDSQPQAMFIGLNPSTADDSVDDPTLNRCIQFAKSWGYGGVCIANLFAYRATNPKDMLIADDPIGPNNDKWLISLAGSSDIVIAAWGDTGVFMGRADHVKGLLKNLHCLKLNNSGEPAHPLYLNSNLKPFPLLK